MSLRVQLRPVIASDLDLFEEDLLSEDGTGSFQWFGFTSTRSLRRQFDDTALLTADGGVLTIVADGAPAGRVEWFKGRWGRPDTSSCLTIAIGVRSERRGRGIGTEAQRQLVTYLFDHTRVERIEAYTDVENAAERRALAKAGFQEEGVIRSGQWRNGGWHDQVLSSIIRSDIT